MQELYSVQDVAQMMRVSERTIRNYLKDGVLTGKKVGAQWRFTKEDVKNLFKEGKISRQITSGHQKAALAFIKQPPAAGVCLLVLNEDVEDKNELKTFVKGLSRYLSRQETFSFSFEYCSRENVAQFIVAGATEIVEAIAKKIRNRRRENHGE